MNLMIDIIGKSIHIEKQNNFFLDAIMSYNN